MKKFAAAALALSLIAGCVTYPQRSSEMVQQLAFLKSHGHSEDDVDLPNHAWLAVLLDVFPLPFPGMGHYYVGDIWDGIITNFTFFLVIPWIRGPIDAYKEAHYRNDVFFIAYAKDHGWFDETDRQPEKAPAKEPEASHEEPAKPAPAPGKTAESSQAKFCPSCGARFPDSAAFCPGCGARR